MHPKIHIATLLAGVYIIGLSLQFAPVLVKSNLIDGQVEKTCPRKDANPATNYAFDAAAETSSQAMTQGIFIPCLSSQQNILAYEGLNFRFNSFRLFTPIKANYESPALPLEPFPPKFA